MGKAIILYRYEMKFGIELIISKWFIDIYELRKELKDIKKSTIKDYEEMLFFGTLKEPMFAIKNLDVLEARSSNNNPDHLCLNLEDNTCKAKKNRYGKMVGKELWIWNKMNEYKRMGCPNKVHLIGKLVPDFRNPKYYTFNVEQIIPA